MYSQSQKEPFWTECFVVMPHVAMRKIRNRSGGLQGGRKGKEISLSPSSSRPFYAKAKWGRKIKEAHLKKSTSCFERRRREAEFKFKLGRPTDFN